MNTLQALMDAKRKLAIKETLTDAERRELDSLNRQIDLLLYRRALQRIAKLEALLRATLPEIRSAAEVARAIDDEEREAALLRLARRMEKAVAER